MESPEIFEGYRRLTAAKKEEEVVESSSSSSVGRNSDLSGGESDGDGDSGEGEIQSSYKAPLDNLEALEEVLPMKRSISKFYCGKSKSFTSLADAVSCSSVKEIVKPENAYTRKRKNLLAHSTFWDKNRNYPPRSNSGSLSKRPANSRSTLALVAILSSCESNINSENHASNLSPPTLCRPPLYPHGRRSPNNQSSSSPPQRTLSSWRSFSLSDLQCATAATATATTPMYTMLIIDALPAELGKDHLQTLTIVAAMQKLSTFSGIHPFDSHHFALLILRSNGYFLDLIVKPFVRMLSDTFWRSVFIQIPGVFKTMCGVMAASSLIITLEEFKLFHDMDRRLYIILTNDLCRDPVESMRIMALWLWLERSSFSHVVKKVSSLPQFLINELADEAVACLNCLTTNPFLPLSELNYDIPMTQSLMDNEISLHYFHQNRLTAIQGIAKVINDVCARLLTDLMQQAIERNNAARTQILISTLVQPSFDRLRIGAQDQVHPDDRTMFVTFSKGYPVGAREIQDFFTRIYGDCVESLHMQEVLPGEQSLFARIVFYSPNSIDLILNGVGKAKFTINGKHVWMRKFVPKRRSSPQSDMLGASALPML
ncbi:hypothetical protein Acr_00g0030470 [Actinidia rufa]|uniref:Uncharacterized protein n=1 Tax=Actinidia rufa TaxID=165716 RepID=A0A7J0DFE6_9ERIC|nr:hypothetical protein Acr_00g0030470 [Actinidia rufa]